MILKFKIWVQVNDIKSKFLNFYLEPVVDLIQRKLSSTGLIDCLEKLLLLTVIVIIAMLLLYTGLIDYLKKCFSFDLNIQVVYCCTLLLHTVIVIVVMLLLYTFAALHLSDKCSVGEGGSHILAELWFW